MFGGFIQEEGEKTYLYYTADNKHYMYRPYDIYEDIIRRVDITDLTLGERETVYPTRDIRYDDSYISVPTFSFYSLPSSSKGRQYFCTTKNGSYPKIFMEHTGSYKSIDIDASLDGFYQYFSLDGFDILKGRANGYGVYGSEIGGFGDYYFVGNFDPEKGEFHALDSIGHAIDFGYSLCNSFLYQEGDKTYLLGMVMEPTQSYEKFRFTMPREFLLRMICFLKSRIPPFMNL